MDDDRVRRLQCHPAGETLPERPEPDRKVRDQLGRRLGADAGADATGYATPLDGHSLVPQMKGIAGSGEVIGEYLAEGAIAPLVMIKRGRYKFVHSPVDPDQLYDLTGDPDEVDNLAHDPQHAGRVQEFRAEVGRRWDLPAVHAEVLASQQRRHLVNHALRSGRYTPWDFQPIRDASKLYVRNDQELGDLEAMARFPPYGA